MQNTNLTWRIYKTTDKYFNYGKKGYMFCEIGLMLDNLSEHQIEALSNLLRLRPDWVPGTCFGSQFEHDAFKWNWAQCPRTGTTSRGSTQQRHCAQLVLWTILNIGHQCRALSLNEPLEVTIVFSANGIRKIRCISDCLSVYISFRF
jgi:hypothetical protein